MNKTPVYVLCSLIFFLCLCGMSISNGPSVSVAGADISHWLEYNGGYDCYGRLDSNMNIEIIQQVPTDNTVEKLMKDAVGYDANKTVRENTAFDGQDNIYFIGLQVSEDAPVNYSSFYVFFFDDFTKATSNASDKMNIFDIYNPAEWVLNEYLYTVENPQEVKQFFIDKELYQ